MLKFVSFLHLQNRHEKHTKIDDNYKSHIKSNQQNDNNNTHKNIKKFLNKTCDKTANTIKEKPPLAGYLKFENDKRNAAKSSVAAAPATIATAAAKCCCSSKARQFCRCSGNDRCATGTPCTTTGCCCCCTASGCSTTRFRSTSTLCGSCCTTTAPRRLPFCRLSTGVCPIRQQLKWAHGTAFGRISATSNCSDCCTASCVREGQQMLAEKRKDSCASTDCITYEKSSVCSSDCYCTCTNASSLQPTAKHPTVFKLSPVKPETSLTQFQMKLKLLTGTTTNCC
uniref:Uncharacterized protein n=1 Tax=Ceratitis capitata TaxID=7213 RepID=W8C344_CERCA